MTPENDADVAPPAAGRADEAADAPLLLHVFPSYGHGGVPIRIATVIGALGRRYRHRILTLDGNGAAGSRLDPALGVEVADPAIDKGRPLAGLMRIRRVLAGCRPGLLLTYNWGAVEWALVNRVFRLCPHIHFESGFGPEEADRQIPRRVLARRVALGGAFAVVVPSRALVDIARGTWRIPAGRLRHVANGVDCALYDCAGDPSAVPGFVPRPGERIVGTVAPLRAEKNLGRLLRTFARAAAGRDVRLMIAGDGAERAALEAEAARLGIAGRVVFAGHVERPEKIYPLFDVFAISSDTEQMPNTVIQAMAASLPVAGTDVGDVKENLAPENAPFIVRRDDEAAQAGAIGRLLDDGRLRAALAAANRRHVVAHYGLERMVAAYAALYDAALATRRRG